MNKDENEEGATNPAILLPVAQEVHKSLKSRPLCKLPPTSTPSGREIWHDPIKQVARQLGATMEPNDKQSDQFESLVEKLAAMPDAALESLIDQVLRSKEASAPLLSQLSDDVRLRLEKAKAQIHRRSRKKRDK
jgi:hypothetical protein